MNLRITATYAATDGSMPESVDIEWSDMTAERPSPGEVMVALDRLLVAPSGRQANTLPMPAGSGTAQHIPNPTVALTHLGVAKTDAELETER